MVEHLLVAFAVHLEQAPVDVMTSRALAFTAAYTNPLLFANARELLIALAPPGALMTNWLPLPSNSPKTPRAGLVDGAVDDAVAVELHLLVLLVYLRFDAATEELVERAKRPARSLLGV
jgi:hypothetical protein